MQQIETALKVDMIRLPFISKNIFKGMFSNLSILSEEEKKLIFDKCADAIQVEYPRKDTYEDGTSLDLSIKRKALISIIDGILD